MVVVADRHGCALVVGDDDGDDAGVDVDDDGDDYYSGWTPLCAPSGRRRCRPESLA